MVITTDAPVCIIVVFTKYVTVKCLIVATLLIVAEPQTLVSVFNIKILKFPIQFNISGFLTVNFLIVATATNRDFKYIFVTSSLQLEQLYYVLYKLHRTSKIPTTLLVTLPRTIPIIPC